LTTINLGLARLGSTRAEIAEVWGEWVDGEARVVWRTSSEWGTAGFFVYRIDLETGEEACLNDILIPSAFVGAGSIYQWADPEAEERGKGSYRLEEVELSGTVLDLGMHSVTFAEPPPVAKLAREEVAALRMPVAAAPLRKRSMRQSAVLKVRFTEEGLYGVSLQSIANGMGRSLEEVEAWLADDGLSFRSKGHPVPILYDEARGRVVFYGEAADNWYTRDAVVLISQDKGLSMTRRAPGSIEGDIVFPVQLRFEKDQYPFDSAVTRPEDFYYWEYVISGHATLGQRDFELDLTGATDGDVALAVRLMGWSNTANDSDHLTEFLFNGTAVGSITFDGQEQVEAEMTIPGALVIDGMNTLSVKGVLQDGYTHSYFVVDRIDAALDRELAPLLEGTALFLAGPASDISAQAFTEPLAVALDDTGIPTWIADENGELPTKTWAITEANERFAVVEADALPLLTPEGAAEDAWFLSPDNRIDYLIITSRDLAAAAQELADYRGDQGLRVGVATFEDICDLMTHGLRTPEAIPELLAYARATWVEAPWMVVLAGNGHYDYLAALNNEMNHVPPMLLQTHDGIFAADGLLADRTGDGLPDVAIGRLPAITIADLEAMIAKIKAYEADFGSDWQNEIVLAADTTDSAAGNFSAANTKLADLASTPYTVAARIDLDTMEINAARANLLGQFEQGAGFIHYTGHGGLMNLSSKGLLKTTDVSAMANPRQPVVVALSCLVGRFEAPGVNSLGELLMRQTDGGAVAVWGPSGLSRNAPASELGEAFYRGILQEGAGTLGLAVLRARRSLHEDMLTRDTLSIYNLLGDPALRIAGNAGDIPSNDSFAQWRWQRFSPDELMDADLSGSSPANFLRYAMGDGELSEPEWPDSSPAPELVRMASESGFVLRWKRRILRSDVDYQLWLSDNLEEWAGASADLRTLSVEADADGIRETVRTWIYCPPSKQIFVGIKAKKK